VLFVPIADGSFDSDLAVICGPDFAVFDKFGPAGRMLHVVPLTTEGELRIAGSADFPGTQPHQWLIWNAYVVVRSWNEIYIYRVDNLFQLELIHSSRIDEDRPPVGGTLAIEIEESFLHVYGVQTKLTVSLDSCEGGCRVEKEAVAEPPRVPGFFPRCEVQKEGYLFALTRAETRSAGPVFQDWFLSRRRLIPTEGPGLDSYQPESLLYLGTRFGETGGDAHLHRG
jgi:hypothetical protein